MDTRTRTYSRKLTSQYIVTTLLLGVLLSYQALLHAEDSEVKEISGMSIIANDEAPKSLFIVPWRSSEIGSETSLSSGLLDDSMRPVDRDVFMREIDFYEIRHAN